MTGMDELFNDPRHPDRPQHPDFWRLSDVVLRQDGATQEEGEAGFLRILDETVDRDSLFYLAQQRAMIMVSQMGLPPSLTPALTTAYLSGVVLGIGFQQAGGHR